MPDSREDLNRSVKEWKIESRHSIKSLEGVGSRSHDIGAEIRMHSFSVDCNTYSNEEEVAVVVSVTCVVVTCFSTLLVKCQKERLRRSAQG